MVGSRAAAPASIATPTRHQLVDEAVRRLRATMSRSADSERAVLARVQVLPEPCGPDPREQYREMAATPLRWVRLT